MWNASVERFCSKKKRLAWLENIEIGLLSVMVLLSGRKRIESNTIIKEKDIRKNSASFSPAALLPITVALGHSNSPILAVNYMTVTLYLQGDLNYFIIKYSLSCLVFLCSF